MAEREYWCPACGSNFLVPPETAEPVLCTCRRPEPVMVLVSIDLSPLTEDPVFQVGLLEANRDAVDHLALEEADGEFGNG